ncbi:MAG: hypothetical protein QXW80_02725 [Candidatus Micrarchaeia archaeon]
MVVVISELYHKTYGKPNELIDWYVVARVMSQSETNPGVAYFYICGPSDSITVVDKDGKQYTIPKRQGIVVYYQGTAQPGETIDTRDAIKGSIFPMPGYYTVVVYAGTYDDANQQFYIHDFEHECVDIEGTPSPSPSPSPTPQQPQTQSYLQYVLIGSAIGLLGGLIISRIAK